MTAVKRWLSPIMVQMNTLYVRESDSQEGRQLILDGDWIIDRSKDITPALRTLSKQGIEIIDGTSIGRIDTWGILELQKIEQKTGAKLLLAPRQQQVFQFLSDKSEIPTAAKESAGLVRLFESMGKAAVDVGHTMYGMMAMIGEITHCFVRNLAHPRSFRFHSIIRHIDETGFRALPIVALLAILISMVISYQAATQLERFGATIFTVDLTVISILREMGVLITAIMVAGRSGSAFAAEIGVMKLREEVDALKTMGFNPIEVLVLPRLIAMMITLPLLAFIADIVGLAGGALIAVLMLDIPLDQYIDRVDMVAKPMMFFVGMIKAPVFAFVITIVGAYQGMNVSGSAESVGRLTTVAVVQSIFLVIMVDALFSIIFSNMGL